MRNLLNKTKETCKKYDIQPTRSKGQNFLINESVYSDIVNASNITKDDVVLEVGPGLGFLTEKLAEKAKKVTAVELDYKIFKYLEEKFKDVDNIELYNEDILNFKFQILNFKSNFNNPIYNVKKEIQNYKIVANLPYQITSYFLRKFLTSEHKPESMVLMLQKEVAERIVAKPPKMSLLSLSTQVFSEPKIIQNVPAGDFWPEPKVDSAVIDFQPHPSPLLAMETEKDFFKIAKAGFGQKRKMLKNNLSRELSVDISEIEDNLKKANIKITVRAQDLSVENWIMLSKLIKIPNIK